MATLQEQFLRRKPVTAMTAETGTDSGEGELERTIGLFQLSMVRLGSIFIPRGLGVRGFWVAAL